MAQRPYFCKPLKPIDGKQDTRLVMAGTPAAARLHVTGNLFEINAATSTEVAQFLSKEGNKLEQASKDGETADLPGTPQS